MNNGTDRLYEDGRSTQGWKKGARVRDLAVLTDGTVLIDISHAFKSENLAVVIEQRPILPGVWASWANEEGMRQDPDVYVIHEFMLNPKFDQDRELFLAVPVGTMDTADFILVVELRYEDYEVYGNQQTPVYQQGVSFATREEAQVALDAVQEEINLMPDTFQDLLSVYIRSNDIPRGDPLEVLRETAGYFIFNELTEELRIDPYWGRFSDEDLERYKQKGKELT